MLIKYQHKMIKYESKQLHSITTLVLYECIQNKLILKLDLDY